MDNLLSFGCLSLGQPTQQAHEQTLHSKLFELALLGCRTAGISGQSIVHPGGSEHQNGLQMLRSGSGTLPRAGSGCNVAHGGSAEYTAQQKLLIAQVRQN